MFVTVTVQTYNNASSLGQMLRSLEALRCPGGIDYEVLVVDNNSTDQTASVVRECRTSLGSRLRYVFEPRQGLSHARNRAIAEARGDIICFIDDDVVVDPGWLTGHMNAYLADSQIVAVGGRVFLRWPDGWTRPAWLTPDLEGCLSCVNAEAAGPLMRFPRYPYGCNMSIRRDMARQIGGFCPALGRKESNLISNDEKLFFYEVHVLGGRVAYAHGAVVHHVVPPSRLTKRFFLKRAYAQGMSDIIFFNEMNPGGRTFMWHLRQVIAGTCRTGWALAIAAARCLPGVRTNGFAALVRASYTLGYASRAARAMVVSPKTPNGSQILDKRLPDDAVGETG